MKKLILGALMVSATAQANIKILQAQLDAHSLEVKNLKQQIYLLTDDNAAKLPAFLSWRNKNANFKLYGALNQAMLYADDGYSSNLFAVTNEIYNSRVGILGSFTADNDPKIGGNIEFGLKINPSYLVSQNTSTVNDPIDVRNAEVFITSEKYGSVYLGRGATSSFNSARVELANPTNILDSGVNFIGGGLYFRSTGTSADYTSDNQINSIFNLINGYGRVNRFLYNTPKFYGFSLSGSVVDAKSRDAGLWYNQNFKYLNAAGAIGITTPKTQNDVTGKFLDGSLSLLFNSGIFTTFSAGEIFVKNNPARQTPYYGYVKTGYQTKIFSPGLTIFGVDCSQNNNYVMNDDKGRSYAFAVAQNFDKFDLSIYAGDRVYTLKRIGATFSNINAITTGAFFKF